MRRYKTAKCPFCKLRWEHVHPDRLGEDGKYNSDETVLLCVGCLEIFPVRGLDTQHTAC